MVNLPTESSHCNDATCTTNYIPNHTCTSCTRHFCGHCVTTFSDLSPLAHLSPLCNSCSLLSENFVVHYSEPTEATDTVPLQRATAAQNSNNLDNTSQQRTVFNSSPAATNATDATENSESQSNPLITNDLQQARRIIADFSRDAPSGYISLQTLLH